VQLRQPIAGSGLADTARQIESWGYATVTMPDHFDDQLAPVPALQAMLSATTTLRAGALVFDNDYKHPLVLAKELATIDVLSGGRVEIGLGAGWMRSDYDQAGMQYDRPGVRIDRFVEGLDVIEGLLGEGPFSYNGEHYTITDHAGSPLPVQRPRPPILIGGGGKRVLTIAAERADIIGVNGNLRAGVIGPDAISTMTAEAVTEKIAIVANAADAAGRLDQIEMNIRTFLVNITEDRRAGVEEIAHMISVEPEMIEASPFALVGNTDELTELIQRRRELYGFSYVIVGADEAEAFAPVVAALAGT